MLGHVCGEGMEGWERLEDAEHAFVPQKKPLVASRWEGNSPPRQYFHVQKFITYQDTDKK